MKKIFKTLSFCLAIIMLIQVSPLTAFATSNSSAQSTIMSMEIDESNGISKLIESYNDSIFYTYLDNDISYCAQITSQGDIQFSYLTRNNGNIFESDVKNINTIYTEYGISKASDTNYELLNQTIINNRNSFNVTQCENMIASEQPFEQPYSGTSSNNVYSTLASAVTANFGANYGGSLKGVAAEKYNGTSYTVYCHESQTSNSYTLHSRTFAKDVAISVISTWVINAVGTVTGGVGFVLSEVIETTIEDGIEYVVNEVTARIGVGERIQTRLVTVAGYSGTQYWAGWTRKMFFLGGNKGWKNWGGYPYNEKHYDYDDIVGLMDTGFQNFINNVLS